MKGFLHSLYDHEEWLKQKKKKNCFGFYKIYYKSDEKM